MASMIQISESEWKVMRVLWNYGALSLGEIIPHLTETGWNGNTIRTLVVRLVEKGIVGAQKHGRNYVYFAIAAEDACVLKETEHFLSRIFDGSPAKLFAALVGSGKLTENDCLEIEKMIEEMKGRE